MLWAHPVAAQEDDRIETADRIEEEMVVSEVLLDAVVTDKKGRVILGLGKDDFVVRESGEEMEILGVNFYSSQERVPSARVDLPGFDLSDVPEDRYFILFIQEIVGGGSSIGRLRGRQIQASRAFHEWAVSELDPADFVAVASYDWKLEVHQDFTRDRQKLIDAIDRAVTGKSTEQQWPSRRPPESELGPLLSYLPSGKELRKATKNIYRGLEVLAGAAAQVPGRKNLIFLGTGFDPIRSSEYLRINPAIAAFNDANVAVYTIDLVPTEIDHTGRGTLNDLAIRTGGDFFFTFVRFEAPLERITRGTSGYYLIAYRSRHPADKTGYQRVKVQLANPEFRVRARNGYAYGQAPEAGSSR
jgi:VWFA-related protein